MVVVTMIKRQGSDQVIQIQSSIKQLKFAHILSFYATTTSSMSAPYIVSINTSATIILFPDVHVMSVLSVRAVYPIELSPKDGSVKPAPTLYINTPIVFPVTADTLVFVLELPAIIVNSKVSNVLGRGGKSRYCSCVSYRSICDCSCKSDFKINLSV